MNGPNPFQIMMQAMQGARSEDEMINKAAQLAPPPPVDFKPPSMPMPVGGMAKMQAPPAQGPTAGLVPAQKPGMVPPMTQGESRTKPRIGDAILGGGY